MKELKPIIVTELNAKFLYMKNLNDLWFPQLYDLQTPCTGSFDPNLNALQAVLAKYKVAPLSRYLEIRLDSPQIRNVLFNALHDKYMILSHVNQNQVYQLVKSLKGVKFRKIYFRTGKTIVYPGEVIPFYKDPRFFTEIQNSLDLFQKWETVMSHCKSGMKRVESHEHFNVDAIAEKLEMERELRMVNQDLAYRQQKLRIHLQWRKKREGQALLIENVVAEIRGVLSQDKSREEIGKELTAIRLGIQNHKPVQQLSYQEVQQMVVKMDELKEEEKEVRLEWEEKSRQVCEMKRRKSLKAKIKQAEYEEQVKRNKQITKEFTATKAKCDHYKKEISKIVNSKLAMRCQDMKKEAERLKQAEKRAQRKFKKKHLMPLNKEQIDEVRDALAGWKEELKEIAKYIGNLSEKQKRTFKAEKNSLFGKIRGLLFRCQQIWLTKQVVDQIVAVRESFMLSELNKGLDRFYSSSLLKLPFSLNLEAKIIEGITKGYTIFLKRDGKQITPDQMSGGQNTLMAMSLLLSIFQTSDLPFLLLDEADAGLDARNIHVFAKMVQIILEGKKQVVAISHVRDFATYGYKTLEVLQNPPAKAEKVIQVQLVRQNET